MISLPKNGSISSEYLEGILNRLDTDVSSLKSIVAALDGSTDLNALSTRQEILSILSDINSIKTRQSLSEAGSGTRSQIQSLATYNGKQVPDVRQYIIPISDRSFWSPDYDTSVDIRGGYATLRQIKRRNLLVIEGSGTNMIPTDLSISVTPDESGGSVVSSSTDLILTDDESSPYYRVVSFGPQSQVQSIKCEIVIQVPSSLYRDSEANLIEVIPHLVGNTRVDYIRIESAGEGVSNLDLDEIGEDARRTAIVFPFSPSSVAKIRIGLTCDTPDFIEGRKKFIYGLKRLGLYSVEYATDGQFAVRVKNRDGRRISALSFVKHNVTRRAISNYTDIESGQPVLNLSVSSVSDSGKSLIFNSVAFESQNGPTGLITLDTPSPELEVVGVFSTAGGNALPPRVYDIAVELIAESDFTNLSTLSPPLPDSESTVYAMRGEREFTLPGLLSSLTTGEVGRIIFPTDVKTAAIKRIIIYAPPALQSAGSGSSAIRGATDSGFTENITNLTITSGSTVATSTPNTIIDVESGGSYYLKLQTGGNHRNCQLYVEYEVLERL